MSVTLISFSTKEYSLSQRLLNTSARLCGVDNCISYTREDLLKTEFYRQHSNILDEKRGAGYWLWKPYYILETLNSLNEGDNLVYADSGILFWKNIKPLTDLVKDGNGIALFYNAYQMKCYTKRDLFIALDCDREPYLSAPLVHAGLQVYRKSPNAISFLEEVLKYATQRTLITDDINKSGKPNFEGFIEHRHDQSIFALTAHKNKITIYLDPTEYRMKNADFIITEGDKFQIQPRYGSIAYVHRYTNKRILCLWIDFMRKCFSRKKTIPTR